VATTASDLSRIESLNPGKESSWFCAGFAESERRCALDPGHPDDR
jgi:hypothetical protein